jgi:hypothetical protein
MRRAAALIAAVVVLGGCGGGDDSKPKDPKSALLGYYDAVGDGDVKKACEFTTGALNSRCGHDTAILTQDRAGRETLAQNAHTLFDKAKYVEKGDLACTAVGGFAFDLQRIDGDWKLTRLRRELKPPATDCTIGLAGA